MTHTRCQHSRYSLTYEEYEELLNEASSGCRICGCLGSEAMHGYLVIDHDASLGDWAVRGLLCSRCNTMLDSHVHVLPAAEVAAHLENPWYVRAFARRGIDYRRPTEPNVGSFLRTRRGAQWRRTTDGWKQFTRAGVVRSSCTWHALWYRNGPYLH